jgi:hypothetical protein
MAETAIQFLEHSRETNVYAQLRALEQLDETATQCKSDAADAGISADDLEKAAGGSLKEYLRAAICVSAWTLGCRSGGPIGRRLTDRCLSPRWRFVNLSAIRQCYRIWKLARGHISGGDNANKLVRSVYVGLTTDIRHWFSARP